MAYRNKTYVAFDGDNDIRYYNMMKAWKQNDNTDFNFYDAHEINDIKDYFPETKIKQMLKEKLLNSKVFVLLVGEHTKYLYKFVKWEIEQALNLNLPIIVVNINNKKNIDNELCPSILKNALAIHISYNAKILQYALENWIESDSKYRQKQEIGPYHYLESVYEGLNLL